ncbi:hypothetical protein CASFOL_004830 [Castilleja foliolosa]|uniref:FAR1 domain-containing protein n=1 Tax=Castilleja foliolosa TaxID=1961234 RepID=A0ABD3EBW1_9LAMI
MEMIVAVENSMPKKDRIVPYYDDPPNFNLDISQGPRIVREGDSVTGEYAEQEIETSIGVDGEETAILGDGSTNALRETRSMKATKLKSIDEDHIMSDDSDDDSTDGENSEKTGAELGEGADLGDEVRAVDKATESVTLKGGDVSKEVNVFELAKDSTGDPDKEMPKIDDGCAPAKSAMTRTRSKRPSPDLTKGKGKCIADAKKLDDDDDFTKISTDPNCVNVTFYVSLGNTQYYTPECAPELKPKIDQRFPTLEAGIDFYRKYATTCGFDTRLGTTVKKDGVFLWRYVTCNKEGEKYIPVAKEGENSFENLESPKTPKFRASSRQNCKALIALKYCGAEGYVVKRFEATHSHPLCDEPFRQFMKVNRNLDAGHQNFVINCAKVNIGPVKSFRMYKEAVGGYANVGCSGVDFKNFSRDLKAFVSGVDAEILLQNLCRKRDTSPEFYFDYVVDQSDHLNRIFWADPICRRSFDAFGDSVSFDATYSTNRGKAGVTLVPTVPQSGAHMDGAGGGGAVPDLEPDEETHLGSVKVKDKKPKLEKSEEESSDDEDDEKHPSLVSRNGAYQIVRAMKAMNAT